MNPLTWQLPPTFQADLISCIENGKSASIIASSNEIQIFVVNDLKSAVTSRANQPDKSVIIEVDSPAKKIKNSKSKTFCLHENGKVSEFVSYKELKEIRGINGCKDLQTVSKGLVLLEKNIGKNLFVAFYSESLSTEERQEFDCGPSLDDDSYSLFVTQVTKTNVNILTNLLGVDLRNQVEMQIVMFSIGSNIFWMEPMEAEYEIRSLRTCSSKVDKFWLSESTESSNIITKSGVLESIYLCPVIGLLTFKKYCLSDNLWTFELLNDSKIVFSSCFEVTLLEIKQGVNGVEFSNRSLPLPGTLALGYLNKLDCIICVTENRTLYTLDFQNKYLPLEERFREADQSFVRAAKRVQKQLKLETYLHLKTQKLIDECDTKKLMLKNLLSEENTNSIELNINYAGKITQNAKNVKVLEPINLSDDHLHTTINVPLKVLKQILNVNQYFLCIEYQDQLLPKCGTFQSCTKTKIVPLASITSTDNILQTLLVTKINSHIILPSLSPYLACFIEMCSEKLLIKIPLKTVKPPVTSLIHAITDQTDIVYETFRKSDLHSLILQLLKFNCTEWCASDLTNLPKETTLMFNYKLKFPKGFDSNVIINKLKITQHRNVVSLNIFNRIVQLEFDFKCQELILKGRDAGALMIAKMFIFKHIFCDSNITANLELDVERECKQILKDYIILLKNPQLTATEIIDSYHKIRNIPIEFIVN